MAETKIAELKHRVALCTMRDVVTKDGEMALSRYPVTWAWASIDHQWHTPSFVGVAGYAIMERSDRPTHKITVRAAIGLEYSSAAWVYEERLKGPPRWYKVIAFAENECWVVLSCHLVEKSDAAQPPAGQLSPRPAGAEL